MKIGISGGSYNPVQKGHIRLANYIVTFGILDKVHMMPCYKSLYNKSLVDGSHRLKMIELSNRVEGVIPFDWEIANKVEGRGTYDIMKELETLFPNDELYFVMGLDNSQKIKKWIKGDKICQEFKFVVVPREGTIVEDKWFLNAPHIYLKSYIPDEISSSLVKEIMKNGGDTSSMLDKEVYDYIIRENLYERKPPMKALLVIDVQNDFCPGGSLAVAGGHEIVPIINKMIELAYANNELVVATQDWHPANHGSFASNHGVPVFSMGTLNGKPQVMWPDHCIEGRIGAELHEELLDIPTVFCKGMDPTVDSYSGFFDNDGKNPTGLAEFLKKNDVTEVTIVGLATDYCVKFTALDAVKLGFKVTVALAACRGVNLNDSVALAVTELENAGVEIV
jgi:nicotinamidase/pyrazinamidase